MRRLLLIIATLVAALLVAFFVTFNSLFSDGPTGLLNSERLVTYGIALVAHGLVAALGARWGGGRWSSWAMMAAAPSVLFATLYAASGEYSVAAFAVLYSGLAVAGAFAGARLARPQPSPT